MAELIFITDESESESESTNGLPEDGITHLDYWMVTGKLNETKNEFEAYKHEYQYNNADIDILNARIAELEKQLDIQTKLARLQEEQLREKHNRINELEYNTAALIQQGTETHDRLLKNNPDTRYRPTGGTK